MEALSASGVCCRGPVMSACCGELGLTAWIDCCGCSNESMEGICEGGAGLDLGWDCWSSFNNASMVRGEKLDCMSKDKTPRGPDGPLK
jgi:hypothetical protein